MKNKKDKKDKKKEKKQNPKAFSVFSFRNLESNARRNEEKKQQRLHVPMREQQNNTVIVVVAGPPKTGKTTLIQSLVKRYTKHKINATGPVTVLVGKKRITFMECDNSISQMIDLSKIADLCLLTIDASFGFEMETFEFLNCLQTHGFPKVMGVLTMLDKFKDSKKLRRTKKILKQRFWTEIYDGAKLFHLSGLVEGYYPATEILNLSRFISVMKYRPLVWRNSHPYLLADRIEDITPPDDIYKNSKVDRTIALYGFLKGSALKNMNCHVPGLGDMVIDEVEALEDPLPIETVSQRLDRKKRVIYAPMSDVGGVSYDKDAVYVTLPEKNYNRDGLDMLETLRESKSSIGDNYGEMKLFSGQQTDDDSEDDIKDIKEESDESGDDEDYLIEDEELEDEVEEDGRIRRRANSKDILNKNDDIEFEEDSDMINSDEEDIEWNDGGVRWKENLAKLATERFYRNRRIKLDDLVYNHVEEDQDTHEIEDHGLYQVKRKKKKIQSLTTIDSTKNEVPDEDIMKFDDDEELEAMRKFFVTYDPQDDENADGDFEDLEADNEEEDVYKESENKSEPKLDEEEDPDIATKGMTVEEERAYHQKRKIALQKKFDQMYESDEEKEETTFYDAEKAKMAEQAALADSEFADLNDEKRVEIQGHQPGSYLRIVFRKVPFEFVENHRANRAIIVGGLLPTELTKGLVASRVKKHRWAKKILKSNDPLIISVGWRRGQTMPLYSLFSEGTRNRMLKYTPEHMHCLATFYGPTVPPGTGFLAIRNMDRTKGFRIALTGVVLDNSKSVDVVKKLKLTGTPDKIFKNTAFVTGMFHSPLEVARFEGAAVRTVSGIRGQVKKAHGKAGVFRATFEDKILKSDIIFLRAWYPVVPKRFYQVVDEMVADFEGVRPTGQIRFEEGLKVQQNVDSFYKPIERKERRFNTLKIPKKLQAALPFKTKPKLAKAQGKEVKLNRKKTAVVLEPREQKIATLIQRINTVRNAKAEAEKSVKDKKRKELIKKQKAIAKVDEEKSSERRKEYFKGEGKRAAKQEGGRRVKSKKE